MRCQGYELIVGTLLAANGLLGMPNSGRGDDNAAGSGSPPPRAVQFTRPLPPGRAGRTEAGTAAPGHLPVTRASFQEQLPPASRDRVGSFEFSEAPLAEALKQFAEQTGWNLVPSSQAAQTRVSLYLKNVAPLVALQALTQANGLWYRRDAKSDVIYIYTHQERPADTPDPSRLERLAEEINQAFPNSCVQLSAIGDQIVVRGEAKDVLEAAQIIQVVSGIAPPLRQDRKKEPPTLNIRRNSFLPDGSELNVGVENLRGELAEAVLSRGTPNVINLLHIPGEQQVMLRVTVAEVDRTAARSIGLNFRWQDNANNSAWSFLGGLLPLNYDGKDLANLPISLDSGQMTLAINALRKLSLARTLAEPNLTTMNGQSAQFHAGGRFPVPVVAGVTTSGLQGVSFVEFGVELKFTPVILDRDRIRLEVSAGVSTKDEDLAANIGGTEEQGGTHVPGLDERSFQTSVELREGQTLAVAGLIQNSFGGNADRVPFFGDLPLIGRLAAHDRLTASEHELVILITPQLVQPLEACELPPLPGSDIFEPGDVEFYLGGHLESVRGSDYRSPVRTDYQRQKRYLHGRDAFIIGPSGYSGGFGGGYPAYGP